MKKVPRPFLQTALCLSLLGTQSMSFAAYQISTSPSNEGKSSSDSVCSLREAVTMVNSQSFEASTNCIAELIEGDVDRITLDAGRYKLKNTLHVTQSLQLQGQSVGLTTIDGSRSSTVLVFDDQSASQRSISLENLNFINGGKNGLRSKSDVGVLSSTENLLLNHVFISRSFGEKASAILIDGATLSILNSVFSDNAGSASVIAATGSSAVSITNTRLSNNKFGTSALLLSNVTDFEINQSEISMNSGKDEAVFGSLGLLDGSEGRLINSTIAGNIAKQEGSSGIYVNASSLEIRNSTISMNTDYSSSASTYISGLLAENGASVTLLNSVLAGNSDNFGHPSDCSVDDSSQISSNGYNVIGDPSLCGNIASDGDSTVNSPTELALLELSNQGGSTQTLVPLPGSPLLDSANNEDCPETDQRGFSRPINNQCDIGAVEMQGAPQAHDIEPLLEKVRVVEEIDILSHVSRKESDIDPETLVVNFYYEENPPENAEGTFKITPNNTLKFFRSDAFDGEVSFTYSVSDIHGRESQTTTILLRDADPIAPEAVDDHYKTEGKEFIQLDVLDNDVRGSSDYDLSTMLIESDVKYGRLAFLGLNSAGGFFAYTPDRGSSGVDSFTYSIATQEGQRSNIATVSIELPSINTGGDDDDDGLGGLNLFMVLGLFGLVLSRRLNKTSA